MIDGNKVVSKPNSACGMGSSPPQRPACNCRHNCISRSYLEVITAQCAALSPAALAIHLGIGQGLRVSAWLLV